MSNFDFLKQTQIFNSFADASIDPDGDEVVAYEYLIGGKVIYNKAGYEGDYETVANPNPGHAGTEGTYIISTPLSSIKHKGRRKCLKDFWHIISHTRKCLCWICWRRC